MKSAVILGASGSVGRVVTQHFSKLGWRVFCLDIAHPPALPPNSSYIPVEYATLSDDDLLHSKITSRLPPASLVLSVAGGWAGGGVKSSSFCSDVQRCMGQNITSAAAAAAISSKLLQANGLLVLTGSAAGLSPSSSMIAYATTKSALHFMVESRIPQPRNPQFDPGFKPQFNPGFSSNPRFMCRCKAWL